VDIPSISSIWGALPEIAKVAGASITALAVLVGVFRWTYNKGVKDGQRKVMYARDREALEKLYAPLVALLIGVHVSSATSVMYSTIDRRFKHAVEIFRERTYLKSKIKGFWHALFDRGVSEPSVGVEYGDSFPTSKIGETIKRSTHLASPILLALYKNAARDEIEGDAMSAAHLKLLDHIYNEHERLTNRLMFSK